MPGVIPEKSMYSESFIRIADPAVTSIPIQDYGEPLVDLQGQPWITTEQPSSDSLLLTKVRNGVGERLKKAARVLPSSYRFKLFEGYRPMKIQQEYFEQYFKMLQQQHPDWDKDHIRLEASIFVAPPDKVPPHTTGGAIDIFLVDELGKEYDLGGGSHHVGNYSDISHTNSQNTTDEQKRLRKILINALSSAGFINYPAEWWHWSYGGRYWAAVTRQPYAIYGSIDD